MEKHIDFFKATLKGINVYFTDERVELPDECLIRLYKYEIRHYNGTPIEISEKVLVDFYGTILSVVKLDLPLVSSFTQLPYNDIKKEEFIVDYNNKISFHRF